MKIICFSIFVIVTFFSSCNERPSKDHLVLGEEWAKRALIESLGDSAIHNITGKGKLLIKNQETAISISETILYSVYGKNKIERQQPYECYFIDQYWVVSGTIAKGSQGGTFLIIISATNSKVIRLIHGK